jgi:3-phenylpropionate/trans-cinnamate dioxygenase ferredoxin subunit
METEGYLPVLDEKDVQEGKMRLARVHDIPVLFIRQKDKLYVLDDRCPHMGCKFSGGSLEGEMVICPCHDWRFNLETGAYEVEPSYRLTFYPFKVESGKIWVKIEEDEG